MSVTMNGVTFGAIHSYTNLSLILNSKEIETPEPKTEIIDIPGSDGQIDFTEFFGGVKFKNRKLTFNFTHIGTPSGFPTALSNIQNVLHGKKMNIKLDDDSSFYYVGRVTVDKWSENKGYATLTISADCEPYKYKNAVTTVTRSITDSGTVSLTNLKKSVVPKISTDAAITIAWTGGSASLSAGNDQIIPELVLGAGTTQITVTGTATVIFKYQEGEL